MDYALVKAVHVGAVALSLGGFFTRGLAALRGASWVRSRPARTLPHIVDTVLLLSALAMAWMLRLTPANAPWLAAKIVSQEEDNVGLLRRSGSCFAQRRKGAE